ncbi:hypothetical protein R1sor_021387 [Riccia sorocarpa]|uniref:Transposase n=1 Tax=Riccia sorocarpa TaxID=122646 RepID=A0ABD3GKN9_9MARC
MAFHREKEPELETLQFFIEGGIRAFRWKVEDIYSSWFQNFVKHSAGLKLLDHKVNTKVLKKDSISRDLDMDTSESGMEMFHVKDEVETNELLDVVTMDLDAERGLCHSIAENNFGGLGHAPTTHLGVHTADLQGLVGVKNVADLTDVKSACDVEGEDPLHFPLSTLTPGDDARDDLLQTAYYGRGTCQHVRPIG